MASGEGIAQKQRNKELAIGDLRDCLTGILYKAEVLRQVFSPFLSSSNLLSDSGKVSFEKNIAETDSSWYIVIDLYAGVGYPTIDLPGGSIGSEIDIHFECFMRLVRTMSEQKFRVMGNDLAAGYFNEELRSALMQYADVKTISDLAHEARALHDKLWSFIFFGFEKKFGKEASVGADDAARQLFWVSNHISSLSLAFLQRTRQLKAGEEAIQKFRCLIFDTANRINETQSFTKSKTLKAIREDLERKSKEIIDEVNW